MNSGALPSMITTADTMTSNYREADDCYDEMSVLSVDTYNFGGRSQEKDSYSISGRKLPRKQLQKQRNNSRPFFGSLKSLTSIITGEGEKKHKHNNEGEDSTFGGSTQSNTIGGYNSNNNEAFVRAIPDVIVDDDDCSKKSTMTELTVDFPNRIRDRSLKKNNMATTTPLSMTVQNFAGRMFSGNMQQQNNIQQEEVQQQHRRRRDPPSCEEHEALEEHLMKTKLELAMVQEKLDHATSRMNRVTKERDWLRTQYSTLQYKYTSNQMSIAEDNTNRYGNCPSGV